MKPTLNNSFIHEVGSFAYENKELCLLTLGIVLIAYALGNMAGRVIYWIVVPVNLTEKTSVLAVEILETNPLKNTNVSIEALLEPADKGRMDELIGNNSKRSTFNSEVESEDQKERDITVEVPLDTIDKNQKLKVETDSSEAFAAALDEWVKSSTSGGEKKEASKLIKEAYSEKSTQLDLINLKLTDLPPFVSQLNFITHLYMHGNSFETIPKEIFQLTELEELDLMANNLTSIPDEIIALKKLQKLHLSYNTIRNMTKNLGNLTELITLSLSSNQLTIFPVEICKLTKLKELKLASNKLCALPEKFGKLIALEHLDLSSNELAAIPKEIGNLIMLKHLDLSSNKLTALPEDIGFLTRLKKLYVKNNVSVTTIESIPRLLLISDQLEYIDILEDLEISDDQ